MTTTLQLELPHPLDHLPGQYYEIRLTAPDGYQAARLYSAANSADGTDRSLDLTVQYMLGGEVSPYLCEHVKTGDRLEIRGPLGRVFVWQTDNPDPVLLVGGGSGVVPLHCIWQAHRASGSDVPLQLVYSAHYYDDIIYRGDFLADPEHVLITLTRDHPADWQGASGRISPELLEHALARLSDLMPMCYVCGMNAFAEVSIGLLLGLGVPPARIRAERFGV